MAKIKRQIIKIDEEKCNGCALCIPACPEGALQIIDGIAKLVKQTFCDGLGACLGDCPEDALHLVDEYVDEYDEQGVIDHLKEKSPELLKKHIEHLKEHGIEPPIHESQKSAAPVMACPSSRMQVWDTDSKQTDGSVNIPSQLRQWPIQLHLVPPTAPYFRSADVSLIADCVPFTYPNFHKEFLKDKAIAIACPKLDNVEPYVEKIKQIILSSQPKSLSVIFLEVPCCSGLVHIAMQAIMASGQDVSFSITRVGIKGEILEKKEIDVQEVMSQIG